MFNAAHLPLGESRNVGLVQTFFQTQLCNSTSVSLITECFSFESLFTSHRVDCNTDCIQIKVNVGLGPVEIAAIFIDREVSSCRFGQRLQGSDFVNWDFVLLKRTGSNEK